MKKLYFIVLLLTVTSLVCGQQSRYTTAPIDSGATTSDSIHVPDGYFLSQIEFPALTSSTDSYSFLVLGNIGQTYLPYWYNGEVYSIAILADGACLDGSVPPSSWGVEWFKVVLDVTQTADRVIGLKFEKKL